MDIKKIILFSLLVALGTASFAQTSNLRKAKAGLLKHQELSKDEHLAQLAKGSLEEAKEAIDAAITHDKTKDDPETWTYYALIYAQLANRDKSAEAAETAEEGIKKAVALDTDGKNKENIEAAHGLLGQYKFGIGVTAFNDSDFQKAFTAFDSALQHLPGDTTLTYYSGMAASQAGDYQTAIERYKLLIPMKEFPERLGVLLDIPKFYFSLQDTASALEYAAKAVEEYPDNNAASLQHIQMNLMAGNFEEIIGNIENQIAKDPNDKLLYYYLGIAYGAADNNEKAIELYKKALEIDPDYLEANMNVSAMIINLVRDRLNALNADKTLSNDAYGLKLEELKDEMKAAVPYLEKVVALAPDDVDALKSLKSCFDFLQDEAKSAEIQAKIQALQQ